MNLLKTAEIFLFRFAWLGMLVSQDLLCNDGGDHLGSLMLHRLPTRFHSPPLCVYPPPPFIF